MDFEIRESVTDGVRVMELCGSLKGADSSGRLRARLKEVLGNGDSQLVVDLAQVGYVDSAGLGALVAGLTTARNQGGNVKLARVGRQFLDQLHITKLVTIFEVYPSVDDAVKSFAAPS
jgi:anti-sigma B factor antagonist